MLTGKINLLAVILLVLFTMPFWSMVLGQTVLPSEISSDLTLRASGSPYRANGDVRVRSGARLTVEAGVTIEFVESAGLYVYGAVTMSGQENSKIHLKSAAGQRYWETVSLLDTQMNSDFTYVEITGSTTGNDPNRDRAAINAHNVNSIVLQNVRISDVHSCIYFNTTNSRCVFESCYFECDERGSVFNLVKADALIQNCEFAGVHGTNSDAIDFDKVTADIIRNRVYGMTGADSDGIDMGSSSVVYLSDNLIYNCTDSGIEAEEGSVITAERNIIVDCGISATIKEEATGYFTNNTFYSNDLCFAAYSETGVTGRGGKVYSTNNIIAGNNQLYSSLHGSEIVFRYNLTYPGSLTGTGNISGDPMFTDPASGDFYLLPGSPAIDAGDPDSPKDPDGSRSDIGAIWFEQTTKESIVIHEIYYNPIINGVADSRYQFIEFYNSSSSPVDVSGYSVTGSINFTFPQGTMMDTEELLILAADKSIYEGDNFRVFEWSSGILNSEEGHLELRNRNSIVFLNLRYTNESPWPEGAKVSNVSIELTNSDLSPVFPTNWRYSFTDGGTPGRENQRTVFSGLFINELVSRYGTLLTDDFGNYTDWIEIYNSNSQTVYLSGLLLYDGDTDPMDCILPICCPDDLRIPPKGFLLFYADDVAHLSPRHLPFQLRSAGESVALSYLINENLYPIDYLEFGPLGEDISYGRMPDGSDQLTTFSNPTPGKSNFTYSIDDYKAIVINEILAKYDDNYPDEFGLYSDWLELYNTGNQPVDLSGLYLSDNSTEPRKHRVPLNIGDSAIIQPGSFKVFRADARPNLGYNHLDFELASNGEEVVLSADINGQLHTVDSKQYPAMPSGYSYGRLGDGGYWWAFFAVPTPGSSNSTTSVSLSEYDTYWPPGTVTQLEVYNLQGQKVLSTDFYFEGYAPQPSDMNQLDTGVYVVVLRSALGSRHYRILIF